MRWGLIGSRLWWRRGSSLAVFAVAVAATMTAVVGPIYADAAAESSLRQVLATAAPDDTGVHLQYQTDVTVDPFGLLERSVPPGFNPAYHQAVRTVLLASRAQGPGPVPPVVTHVAWREGACAHLVIVSGRCPRGPNEVVASKRTGGPQWGFRVGATVVVDGLPQDQPNPDGSVVAEPGRLQVVGLYEPRSVDDRFWFGHDYFGAHPGSGPLGDGPDTIDDLFVDRPAIDGAAAGTQGPVWIDYFLDPSRVSRAALTSLRADVAGVQRQFPVTDHPAATTQLPLVLARAHRAGSGLTSGTAIVTLQLLLLAWLVLFEVVAASAEARASEVAVAKLRGLRSRDVALFALSEPLVLMVAATPVGILAGWLAARGLASRVLLSGVPVRVGGWALAAAAVALAGGLVAAALASRRILHRQVLEQWRRAEEHADRGRRMLLVDLAVAAVAVVTLAVLKSRSGIADGRSDVMLVAPALVVLAAALVGLRALPFIAAAGAAMTRASRHIGGFLATRQVARRHTGQRFAVLLAVATGLAVFSVAANDVVRQNEKSRAQVEVGADRVVTVKAAAGVDLASAVGKVDPHGDWAMAAASWTPVGGSVGVPIEAVDTSRLRRLGYYDPALTRLLPGLRAHSARPVVVSGDQVRVTLSVTGVIGRPHLDVTFLDHPGHTVTSSSAAAVTHGTQTVSVSLPCSPCELVGVAVDRGVGDFETMRGSWTMSRIEVRQRGTWAGLDAQLTKPGAWRAGHDQTNGSDDVRVGPNGVTDTFTAEAGGWPSVELADLPRPLPVALGVDATATTTTAPYVNDLAGAPVQLTRAATVAQVPRLLGGGGLADLAAARRALPAFDQLSRLQVWLGPHAPRDALDRLRRAGLELGESDAVATHVESLRQQGPALALQLFLFASLACSLLALAATSLALAASGRRRAFELAALQAVGVRRGALLRACVIEQAILLGSAVLLGIVPGVIAARLSLPAVPEFVDVAPNSLSYAPAAGVVAAFVIALSVTVLVVAAVGGASLLRAAVPARLREASP